jgi:Carboxypeptidase regulatory-like domain
MRFIPAEIRRVGGWRWVAVLALPLLVVSPTCAQNAAAVRPEMQPLAEPAPGMLFGRVTDRNGFAIVGAEILVATSGQTATADTLGRFVITGLRPQSHFVRVRKIGYFAEYLNIVSTVSGAVRANIALESMGTSLSEVVVRADRITPRLQRFYDRKALGNSGQFATREEFAARGWTTLRDVLSSMRGVRIGSDEQGRPTLVTGAGAGCPVSILLDGQALALDAVSLSAMVNLRDLAGVEVYASGDMPMEFRFAARASGGCGAAVLWTR